MVEINKKDAAWAIVITALIAVSLGYLHFVRPDWAYPKQTDAPTMCTQSRSYFLNGEFQYNITDVDECWMWDLTEFCPNRTKWSCVGGRDNCPSFEDAEIMYENHEDASVLYCSPTNETTCHCDVMMWDSWLEEYNSNEAVHEGCDDIYLPLDPDTVTLSDEIGDEVCNRVGAGTSGVMVTLMSGSHYGSGDTGTFKVLCCNEYEEITEVFVKGDVYCEEGMTYTYLKFHEMYLGDYPEETKDLVCDNKLEYEEIDMMVRKMRHQFGLECYDVSELPYTLTVENSTLNFTMEQSIEGSPAFLCCNDDDICAYMSLEMMKDA